MHCHDNPATNAADHGIQFHMALQVSFGYIVQEVIIRAAQLETRGHVVVLMGFSGLELNGPGEVYHGCRIVPLLEMTVDRAFRAGDFRGAGHDMVDVLSLPQPFRDDPVGLVEFLFVEQSALAGIRQECLVLGLSGGGTIVEVREVAGSGGSLLASVANKGSLEELRASAILRSEGVAVFTTMVLDLARNGRGVLLDELGYVLEGHLPAEAVLDLFAVFRCQVFVF